MSENTNPNYDLPDEDEMILFNVDKNQYPIDNEESSARALFNMTEPTTDIAKLTMSAVSIRWIVLGNLLKEFERRLNDLVSIPNGLRKPIYPRSVFLTNFKDAVDAQSPARKGESRKQLMTILANQMSGGFPRMGMDMITKPFENPGKKRFWQRGKENNEAYAKPIDASHH